MSSGGDKVEKSMNSVVSEARITLDARLLGQNIIVLTFKVANNLLETGIKQVDLLTRRIVKVNAYANSLSILSPKPGVSTMVKAMRTPSSSSSVKWIYYEQPKKDARKKNGGGLPTLHGLILMPSSTCADPGSSEIL